MRKRSQRKQQRCRYAAIASPAEVFLLVFAAKRSRRPRSAARPE